MTSESHKHIIKKLSLGIFLIVQSLSKRSPLALRQSTFA